MLSRAAERIYWTGRYLERAEDTARLVQQYSQLLLDLPEEVGVEWSELVRIVGAAAPYEASATSADEQATLEFLLADPDSQSSLAYSLRMARENIRNTRDLLPLESWESVNELHQFARESLGPAASGSDRFEVLAECIARCQQICGILSGTMSHQEPYHFLTLGQNLERADMTSRVVDVAAAYIQHNERVVRRYGSSLWTNLLKSVSGFQMYRQYRQPAMQGSVVINFLLADRYFPRAITCCVENAKRSSNALPHAATTVAALEAVTEFLVPIPDGQVTAATVSNLMDTVQSRLGDVHRAVVDTWFLPGGAG